MDLSKYSLNLEKLAYEVRAKRGDQTLKQVADIVELSTATLSRVERGGHMTDWYGFLRLCSWLDIPPGEFVITRNSGDSNDLSIQLRAAKNMSPETAEALMGVVKALYEQMRAETDQIETDNDEDEEE